MKWPSKFYSQCGAKYWGVEQCPEPLGAPLAILHLRSWGFDFWELLQFRSSDNCRVISNQITLDYNYSI